MSERVFRGSIQITRLQSPRSEDVLAKSGAAGALILKAKERGRFLCRNTHQIQVVSSGVPT